jgi:integrase
VARPSKIWQRSSDDYWYCTHNGEKVKLSKDKAEAERAFHTLKAHGSLAPGEDAAENSGPRPSLRYLVGLYLDEAKATKAEETYQVQRRYLTGFCDFVGKIKAPDVRIHHVKDWLAADKKRNTRSGKILLCKWGESTRALAVSTLIALFNWAIADQRLVVSPIKGIKRGHFKRRERIIPPGQQTKILNECGPELRDFLTMLSLTGARPFSEIAKLTAEGVDFDNGLILPEQHKTAKMGKPRIIVLVPEALVIVRRLADQHPTGPLFRCSTGRPWYRQLVNQSLHRAAARAGLGHYSTYDLRRSMITQALANGLSANVVAQLVGNTPAIINKYYDSLHLRIDMLKEAAIKAAQNDESPGR